MKAIIFIVAFFSCMSLFSQDIASYWFDTFYYEKEGIEIPSLQYKMVNREPLEKALKKRREEDPSSLIAERIAIDQEVNINILDHVKNIKINKDTTIYFLHVKANDLLTAYIDVYMPKNILTQQLYPDGKIERIIPGEQEVGDNKNKISYKHMYFHSSHYNEFILKFFVTGKENRKDIELIINKLLCEGMVNKDKNINFKSLQGIDDNCGNAVACMPGVEDWVNQYSGVFEIIIDNIKDINNPHQWHTVNASAFVLNTADNYNMDKSSKPYALTCYHLLDPVISNGYDIYETLADKKEDDNINCRIKFDYMRHTCDGEVRPTWEIHPEFEIVEKGDWHDVGDLDEDYLLLKFNDESWATIQEIKYKYDVESYPGWRNDLKTNYDYSTVAPVYIFHHADEDGFFEMKYAKDNQYAVTDQSGKFINMHIDEGYTTIGASGAPIFGGDHSIIGMIIAGRNTCENPHLQGTQGLSFSYLWEKAHLENYLGSAEKVYAMNTSWSNLPAHCDNCEYDFDKGETGLDCGGPCKPCKVFLGEDVDINTFKSTNLPEVVQADNISVSGTSANPVTIDKNLLLNAKNSITLNKDINIGNNLELKTGRISIVVSREEDVLCNLQYGNYLYWGQTYTISVKNATKFSFILSSATQDVYSNSGDIYYDGIIDVWDSNLGDHVNRNESMVLFFILKLWDTVGGYHQVRGNVTMFPS